jgi:hypothetical protein
MAQPDDILKHYLESEQVFDSCSAEKLTRLGLTDREKFRRLRQFVLAEGRPFDVTPNLSPYIPQRTGKCFHESQRLATYGDVTYVEGFALPPKGTVALHHAWCVDGKGELKDCTWVNEGKAYFGIGFCHKYVVSRWEARVVYDGVDYSLFNERLNDWEEFKRTIADWKSLF